MPALKRVFEEVEYLRFGSENSEIERRKEPCKGFSFDNITENPIKLPLENFEL